MNGVRLHRAEGESVNGDGFVYRCVSTPGAYGFDGAQWWGCTPNGLGANLLKHKTVEHEDGTITVSPSILVNAGREESWHGFLERGVWREC
jgi:hypothetical protein